MLLLVKFNWRQGLFRVPNLVIVFDIDVLIEGTKGGGVALLVADSVVYDTKDRLPVPRRNSCHLIVLLLESSVAIFDRVELL